MEMEKPLEERELWTVSEFADYLRISIGAARMMMCRGELPPESVIRIGRRIRLRASLIRDWVGKSVA